MTAPSTQPLTPCRVYYPISYLSIPTSFRSTNLQLDLEVCGLEGALSVLSQYISSLQSSQMEKRKALEILEEKKKRIEGFTNSAVSTYYICLLMRVLYYLSPQWSLNNGILSVTSMVCDVNPCTLSVNPCTLSVTNIIYSM